MCTLLLKRLQNRVTNFNHSKWNLKNGNKFIFLSPDIIFFFKNLSTALAQKTTYPKSVMPKSVFIILVPLPNPLHHAYFGRATGTKARQQTILHQPIACPTYTLQHGNLVPITNTLSSLSLTFSGSESISELNALPLVAGTGTHSIPFSSFFLFVIVLRQCNSHSSWATVNVPPRWMGRDSRGMCSASCKTNRRRVLLRIPSEIGDRKSITIKKNTHIVYELPKRVLTWGILTV